MASGARAVTAVAGPASGSTARPSATAAGDGDRAASTSRTEPVARAWFRTALLASDRGVPAVSSPR